MSAFCGRYAAESECGSCPLEGNANPVRCGCAIRAQNENTNYKITHGALLASSKALFSRKMTDILNRSTIKFTFSLKFILVLLHAWWWPSSKTQSRHLCQVIAWKVRRRDGRLGNDVVMCKVARGRDTSTRATEENVVEGAIERSDVIGVG